MWMAEAPPSLCKFWGHAEEWRHRSFSQSDTSLAPLVNLADMWQKVSPNSTNPVHLTIHLNSHLHPFLILLSPSSILQNNNE